MERKIDLNAFDIQFAWDEEAQSWMGTSKAVRGFIAWGTFEEIARHADLAIPGLLEPYVPPANTSLPTC